MVKNTTGIYIIDDDESIRRGLSRLIRAAGYEPITYGTIEKFLEDVKNETNSCILLDITMPGTTGLLVLEQLRKQGIHLPVIAISARDDEEIHQLAHEQGLKFFFHKPVDDQALLDAIAWALGSKK